MNNLRNKVQLIGNLGADPEVKSTTKGKKFVNFSMATTEAYRNSSGELVKETEWHRVVAWGKNADIIEQYVVKGSEIAIEGKLNHRSYEDEAGKTRVYTQVIAFAVLLIKTPRSTEKVA